MFDLSINLGNVLTVIAFLAGGFGFVYSVKTDSKVLSKTIELTDKQNEVRFVRIDAQMENFSREMKKLGDVLVELTRQDGRMNTADERLLAQGKRVDSLAETMKQLLLRSDAIR